MRRSFILSAVAVCLGVMLACATLPARADTFFFASGIESNGNSGTALATCAKWSDVGGSIGLTRSLEPECSRHYYTPLYWRNFLGAGINRTVSITYRRANSAAMVECSVLVFNSEGVLTSSSQTPMPVTGANYGTVNYVVNNIVSTGTSFIACTQLTGDSWLLKVSWSP